MGKIIILSSWYYDDRWRLLLADAVKVWEFQARNEIRDVCISKSGELVVAGISDGTLLLLDHAGKPIWQRDVGAPIMKVRMSQDGEFIALTTGDSKDHFYDRGGNPLWRMQLKQPIPGLSMNSTGSSVVIGSENQNTYVYDRSGKLLWGARMGGPVTDVAISLNGNYVVAGSIDHTIYLLDIGGRLVWSYRTEGPIQAVAISDNGDYLMASSQDKRLYFFDRSGSLIWNPRNTEAALTMDMSISARNMVIAVGSEVHLLTRQGSLLRRWQGQERVMDVVISANGEFAAAASADDHVYFFDPSGEELWRHKGQDDILSVAMTAAGEHVVAGGRDRTVTCFDNITFFQNCMSQAAKTLIAVREFGANALEAEVLMQRADSEFGRKEFTSALNYARGAEKVALRIKEKSRPDMAMLAVSSESFNIDSPTRLNMVIMNTGSAHARELRLDFKGQVAVEGPMRVWGIQTGKYVSETYNLRPLVAATIPIKLTISYWDTEGKEYLLESVFNLIGGEAGRKVSYGKNQPVFQAGNVQRLIARVQASKKEAPVRPAGAHIAHSIATPKAPQAASVAAAQKAPTAASALGPRMAAPAAPAAFTPDARCPMCGKGVRKEWPACPFCHAKFRTG